MRVAVLGTGKMGAAAARRLAHEGFEVVLWNRTGERAQELGIGSVSGSPAEAVEEAVGGTPGHGAIREYVVRLHLQVRGHEPVDT